MIAQEWREWVMDKFQHIEFPDLRHKECIAQRIAWISDAREVGRMEIVQLRYSTGWDESAELSLLQVLRQIGRELRSIHDKWRYFQLQQGFARQAGIICGFLVQLIRCGVRFLHKLLNQDELRLKDAAEGIGKDPGYCCCFGIHKWYANSLYTQIAAWADDVSLWDPTFPVGYLARFFNDDKVSEIEANVSHLIRKPAVSPFAPWNEDVMSPDEKKLADDVLWGLKSEAFGLEDRNLRVMVQRSATLFTELKCLTECAMVLQTLMTFSGLGGTLFLTNKLSSQHVVEVMEFVCARPRLGRNDVIAIGDIAEAGWSYLRRTGVESMWSNSSPVDNARLGLRVRSDMHAIVKEVRYYCQGVQAETISAAEMQQNEIEEEITQEVNLYERLWKIVHSRFDKTGEGATAAAVQTAGLRLCAIQGRGAVISMNFVWCDDRLDCCKQAWLHFGNGWGIIDASGRSLYDTDLHALAGGNKMTDAGFQEVLALLQQFRSHVGREGRTRWQSSESCELEEADGTLQLESLNVASNTMLHFREAGLVQSLPTSIASLTALTALDISFVPFNGRIAVSLARSLAKSCAVLRNLSLAGCGLGLCGQADCVALASLLGDCSQPEEAGFQGLERADFSGNFFGGAGFAAAAMAVGRSRIRSLAFAGNSNPPSSDMSPAEWSALLLLRQRSPEREVDKVRALEREPAPAIQIALAAGHNPLQLFLEGLQANSTLEELDVSSCSMGADSAWVLQEALRRHQKLKQLRLCDNPLGEQGLRYVLRLITEMDQHLQGADISGHRESDIRCPAVKYRHAQPSGNYRLNLGLPTDRAILRMLLCHATRLPSVEKDAKGRWLVPTAGSWNVTYAPPLSEASYMQLKEAAAEDVHKPEIEQAPPPPASPRGRSQVGRAKLDASGSQALSIPQVPPMSHGTGHHGSVANVMEGPQAQVEKEKQRVVLAPGLPGTPEGDWMEVHDLIQDCRAKVRAPAFNLFKQALTVMVTDEERLRFARALGKELWFTEAQVKVLTETSAEMAVQLVCFLFPALRSRRFQLALVQQITEPSKMTKVCDSVRHLLWFQDTNPTGSYNLDLSTPVDYALAECCLLVNAWESESARCAGRPDLSQSGNFEMIRNEAYNDVPFVYSKDWLLPSSGWFRFEYSSTRRPPPDATTMNEVSEITRLLRNKDLSSQSQLQALRAASVHLFISSNQCRALVQCFPSAPESSSQDAVNSGTDESPDRQEAFCILHTRVVDRERLLGPEVVYSPVVVQQIGMGHRGTSVLVRGGMFKTGELEMKSAEA
ncbi:dfa3, partial [Symbiodinium necroappetens]